MSSHLQQLIKRFYPSEHDLSITVLGDNWCGKSSLVDTCGGVSTYGIGLRSSPVEVPTSNGRLWKFNAYDIGLGCGSIRTMGLAYARLIATTDALIWVVDASEREFVRVAVGDLTYLVYEIEDEREKSGKKREFPILILANKQDLPNATPVDAVREIFRDFTRNHICMVLPTSVTKHYAESGLQPCMDWLQLMLENPSLLNFAKLLPTTRPEPQKSSKELTNKIETWVNKLDKDVDDEEVIRLFETFQLPAWDHYTHIRIAYVLLSTHGRQNGKDMIFEGLRAYIAQSPPHLGRAFNFTMTYFWIQIVYLGIRNVAMRQVPEAVTQSTPTLSSKEKDAFAHFLLLNPFVADGSLWTHYYSFECMMGPTAKASMVLPDKKPLPNLVVRDAIQTQ